MGKSSAPDPIRGMYSDFDSYNPKWHVMFLVTAEDRI